MDIPYLLSRFADDTATEAERTAFADYLEGLSPEEYEALMVQYEEISQGRPFEEGGAVPQRVFDGATVPANVFERIGVLERLEWRREEASPRRGLIRRMILIPAACVLLIVAGYFMLKRPTSTIVPVTAAATTAPIGPGGNKAVLTLGNGSTIVLDSAANGRLTGNVVKVGDGKLQYEAAGAEGNGAGTSNAAGAEAMYNTLTTPRGGQYQVTLADGTKVWLNAASSIRYPTVFAGRDRQVEITGEVYFEVAKEDAHPFIVKVAGMHVDVLGTSFNIKAYEGVRTTLLEGAVRVGATKVLRPGQQADERLQISNDVDLESVMAWKNGKLAFSKGSVKELMQEISRWYDVDVRYQGDIPSGGFYGLIDRNVPLTSILKALNAYGVKTRLDNKTIIVQ